MFFSKGNKSDNLFPVSKKVNLQELTGYPTRKGLECAIISGGKIVNTVSDNYGHLDNTTFFGNAFMNLDAAGVKYLTNQINREDCSFACDFILQDENSVMTIGKGGKDELRPLLRFVNSYDGTCKTSGTFGVYRKVCSNGLHIAVKEVSFSAKHSGTIEEVVLPRLESLCENFITNEYYDLSQKFKSLAARPINDIKAEVRKIAEASNIFKYEASAKNPEPSKAARTVIQTIEREADELGVTPNRWLLYNSFNEYLHDTKKSFDIQRKFDHQLFRLALA